MTEVEFIKKFTSEENIVDNRYSSFTLALIDARKLTGRNVFTGKDEKHILQSKKNGYLSPYSFIGVVNYLILLEMVGRIFTSPKPPVTGSAIYRALYHFSDVDEKDRYTIDALRNTLVHSYSLVNIPKQAKNNSNSRHIFTLSALSDSPLIKYPDINWDGKFNNKTDSRSTLIQTTKLIDLVERVVGNVKSVVNESDSSVSRMSLSELKARYTILR